MDQSTNAIVQLVTFLCRQKLQHHLVRARTMIIMYATEFYQKSNIDAENSPLFCLISKKRRKIEKNREKINRFAYQFANVSIVANSHAILLL